MTAPVNRRYPTLDLLRLVAISLTMLMHTPSVSRRLVLLRPFSGGFWLGVDLFMLISGWLLGGQLLREKREGTFNPPRFYLKRWLRTLPLYYAVLAALYYGAGREFAGPLPLQTVTAHVLFAQGYLAPNLFAVSWSLCVEEHFYLALPLLIVVITRWPRLRVVLGLVVGAELTALGLRSYIFANTPYSLDVPYLSVLRNHGLFIGLLLAWIQLERPALWERIGESARPLLLTGLVTTALVMFSAVPPPSPWLYVALPTLGTWSFTLVFIACVHPSSAASRIDFRGLSYLGGLTYAMYLVHTVIPRAWLEALDVGPTGQAAWRLVVVIALSMLLHHTIERPGLWLREKLLSRWRQPRFGTGDVELQPKSDHG